MFSRVQNTQKINIHNLKFLIFPELCPEAEPKPQTPKHPVSMHSQNKFPTFNSNSMLEYSKIKIFSFHLRLQNEPQNSNYIERKRKRKNPRKQRIEERHLAFEIVAVPIGFVMELLL